MDDDDVCVYDGWITRFSVTPIKCGPATSSFEFAELLSGGPCMAGWRNNRIEVSFLLSDW